MPNQIDLMVNAELKKALLLHRQGRLAEAKSQYEQILKLDSNHFDAVNLLATIFAQTQNFQVALDLFDKAISIDPEFALTYNNRGNVLLSLKRLDEALANYDKALVLMPDSAEFSYNRGNALLALKRLDEALISYNKALLLNPDYEFLFGSLLLVKMRICDWKNLDENLRKFQSNIYLFKRITSPFYSLLLLDNPVAHKIAAKVFAEAKYPKCNSLGPFQKRNKGEKIRVGYYSADFYGHATSYLMAELFEAHNGNKFELYGFTFGPDINDDMSQRISSAFDRFIDVRQMSDRDIAKLSRDLCIDIAVDLKGYTQDSRTGIFAEGAAPVQVNFLGYPGTMGSDYYDYIIADKIVIPEKDQSLYTETVVYLPCYQANDSKREISDKVFTKKELGLPETGFVFCCFNNNFKIQPETFDSWMRILGAVENSVLWLFEDNPTAAINLRKQAEARNIHSNRLVFAKRLPIDEHLARHKLADLFIDTLPCNAHTTASDALWAGLPVLTCIGKSFAGRVAASLLNTAGLPELVAQTLEEYETKAIELALNKDKLLEIKNKLEKSKNESTLFNGRLFAGHIEMAYVAMYDRYQSGLPNEMIDIQHCFSNTPS
jgi:protein O-GlcNAc transferase